MKFCKSISIVTQNDAALHTSPLSYLVQADGEHTKEYESNIKSAKQWAVGWQKEAKVYTFENFPTNGFKIAAIATRYSTSNKFYRIIDPRGFQLEISTANLLEIVQTGEIAYGEIIGKYVWVKSTRDYLCSVNHPEYKRWLNPPAKEKSKTLDIGDLVVLPNDGEALYIGKKYMLEGCIKGTTNPDWRYANPNLVPYYLYDVSVKHPEKPVHVFLTAYGVATRSRLENFKLISQSESKYFNQIMKRKEEYTTPYNENYRSFFETREELLANKDAFLKQFHTEMVKGYGADAVRRIAV
jgi:hypothetical protein